MSGKLVDTFKGLRVLVLGDVMIDSYLWGHVSRISPEAPVPIVNVKSREKRLGGAGNVAMNIKALGGTPLLCSVIGADNDGDELLDLCRQSGLETEGIIQSKSRVTTIKHRIISGSQQLLRVDSETENDLNETEQQLLTNKIELLLSNSDVVIFQDYNKGTLTIENIPLFIELANRENVPTVVDPKKKNFWEYKHVTLFKPNLKELKEGLFSLEDLSQPEAWKIATSQLHKKLQNNISFITLSEKGVFITDHTSSHHLPAHRRSISDVSGAGDTVISIAALALASGFTLKTIAALANLGGGLVCEEVGVVPINMDRFIKEVENLSILPEEWVSNT